MPGDPSTLVKLYSDHVKCIKRDRSIGSLRRQTEWFKALIYMQRWSADLIGDLGSLEFTGFSAFMRMKLKHG